MSDCLGCAAGVDTSGFVYEWEDGVTGRVFEFLNDAGDVVATVSSCPSHVLIFGRLHRASSFRDVLP